MAVVKEAATAVGDMPWLIGFPIGPFIFALLYFAFWITVTLFIFSVGELKDAPLSQEWINAVKTIPVYKNTMWAPITTFKNWAWKAEGFKCASSFSPHFGLSRTDSCRLRCCIVQTRSPSTSSTCCG